ncbi:TonB-dependent receptor plug domain-containing protein, partial [candidate division KSB1 bacterium]|nr:TonB-dependent receptor plug domain-containing protein [candidate division KSB1 bacterium]
MSRKFLLVLLCLMLAPALVFAQTGKIKGKVVDRETGDPLPGANVIVEGTSLGAAADVNGEYYILNIPAGVYSVRASFIGYRDVTISNVNINVNLTTTLDFEMPSEAVEVSEIEIVAERPLVNKSATNAVRIASAETFEKLPIRGTTAVYALQPGVTQQNGQIYIRGGRSDEVGFMVEGSNARNIMTGDNSINVIPEALEEAQIQAGGYNAEFGGANAGIISQTLRSGSNAFNARLQLESDNWPGQSAGDQVLDTFSYGYEDFVLTLSGPLVKNRIKFFVAGQRTHFDDSRRVFWSG